MERIPCEHGLRDRRQCLTCSPVREHRSDTRAMLGNETEQERVKRDADRALETAAGSAVRGTHVADTGGGRKVGCKRVAIRKRATMTTIAPRRGARRDPVLVGASFDVTPVARLVRPPGTWTNDRNKRAALDKRKHKVYARVGWQSSPFGDDYTAPGRKKE